MYGLAGANVFVGPNLKKTVDNAVITGANAEVTGSGNTVTGSNPVVIGDRNTVTGSNASVTGNGNRVTGSNARVIGNGNTVTGTNATAEGNGNTVKSHGSSSIVQNMTGSWSSSSSSSSSIGQPNRVVIGSGLGNMMVFNNYPGSVIGGVVTGSGDEKNKRQREEEEERETQYVEGPLPTDLPEDVAEPDSGKACVICMERKPICVALPCMHQCYCVECARSMCFGVEGVDLKEQGSVKCAKCRSPVDSIKRIFLYFFCCLGTRAATFMQTGS